MSEYMKRRLITLCIAIVLILVNAPFAYAYTAEDNFEEQDFYVETTISAENDILENFEVMPLSTKKNITKTKTTTVKTKTGVALWSVSITATFSYDGKTSQCISCSHDAESFKKEWKIKSVSSKKSGNTATASAIAACSQGSITREFNQSVTISCSATGVVS